MTIFTAPRKKRRLASLSLILLALVIGRYISVVDFSHFDRHFLPYLAALILFLACGLTAFLITTLLRRLQLPAFKTLAPKAMFPSGIAKPSKMLINRPRLQSYVNHFFEATFSLTLWLVFLYLFQPLFSSLAWLLTNQWLYWSVFSPAAIHGTLEALLASFLFACLVALSFFIWAKWNLRLYGGLDRRKPRPALKDDEIARIFEVSTEILELARQTKIGSINPSPSGMTITQRQLNLPLAEERIS